MIEFERGPLLWLPKYKDVVVAAKLPPANIRGRWLLEAVNADTGRKRFLAEFPNLITTNGGNLYGTTGNQLGYCLVGTGNTAPTLADTGLQTFLASTSTAGPANYTISGSGSAGPTYWGQIQIQYAFSAGVATGNLSEIGVGPASTNTNIFSHALILDGGGAPTTITVLSNEALYATYTLQQYAPTADVTGNVTIASVNYAYVLRAYNAGSTQWAPGGYSFAGNSAGLGNSGGGAGAYAYSGTIGALTSTPTGSQVACSAQQTNSYSAGSFGYTGSATWGLTSNLPSNANFTAIAMQWGTHGWYQFSLSPGIPKDGSHVLVLDVGHTWTINSP